MQPPKGPALLDRMNSPSNCHLRIQYKAKCVSGHRVRFSLHNESYHAPTSAVQQAVWKSNRTAVHVSDPSSTSSNSSAISSQVDASSGRNGESVSMSTFAAATSSQESHKQHLSAAAKMDNRAMIRQRERLLASNFIFSSIY